MLARVVGSDWSMQVFLSCVSISGTCAMVLEEGIADQRKNDHVLKSSVVCIEIRIERRGIKVRVLSGIVLLSFSSSAN